MSMIHPPAPLSVSRPVHDWLRQIKLSFAPGPMTPLLETFSAELLRNFRQRGHTVYDTPQPDTQVLVTTATYGEPMRWRDAMFFIARKRFNLEHTPIIFTLIHMTQAQFQQALDHFTHALANEYPDPADYNFPGLSPNAMHTLHEQGRRGGPIMALLRLLQSQALSIRIILVVGDEKPLEAYTFDLVGAYPRTLADNPDNFYEDLLLRMVTAASTNEITSHVLESEMIPGEIWFSLTTPDDMVTAGRELGTRHFFTEMVRIANLVTVPVMDGAVSSQYSEGCFATWEPKINALIATVTGSARPVDKFKLTHDELAVIVGVRADGKGARIRHVDGKRNDPPSSEAVEMIEMDADLPRILLGEGWEDQVEVPVSRSKLHGHRGVRAFDPRFVEHVSLDEPYYHYPVSCSTEAQAHAIKSAFSRSQALLDPADPRQVVFTVLPGHGIVVVEKWVMGKVPFQVMWEYMDAGYLQVENKVPQGLLTFVPDEDGLLHLRIQ